MQFQVPQFIEVEDKIFGPLTFRQFVYIGGALGSCYIFWRVLPIYIALPLMLAVGGLGASLAFAQINGRPFIIGMENAFFFLTRNKLYLWSNAQKKNAPPSAAPKLAEGVVPVYVPKLSGSKLHELSWSLDIKERVAQGIASEEDRGVRPNEDVLTLTRTPQQTLNQMTQATT